MTAVTNELTADRRWRSRGELLAARAAAVPELEGRLFSLSRLARQALLTLVITVAGPVAGVMFDEQGEGGVGIAVRAVIAVLAVVAGAAALPPAVRMVSANRALMAELLAWEAAEEAGRELPAGDVRREHRTPFDARRDPDFGAVAAQAGAAAYTRARRGAFLARVALVGAGLGLGLILVVAGAAAMPQGVGIGATVSGSLVLAGALVGAVGVTRFNFRLTRLSARLDADVRQLMAGRLGDEEPPLSPWRQMLMLAPVAAPLLLFLVFRLRQSSVGAVAIAIGLLVVAAIVGGVVLLVRSRRSSRRP